MLLKVKQLVEVNTSKSTELSEDDFLRKLQEEKEEENIVRQEIDAYIRITSMDDINNICQSVDREGQLDGNSVLELIECKQPFMTEFYKVKLTPEKLINYIEKELQAHFDVQLKKAQDKIRETEEFKLKVTEEFKTQWNKLIEECTKEQEISENLREEENAHNLRED